MGTPHKHPAHSEPLAPDGLETGFIKLYRKTLKSRVFQNEGLLKVWLWCLLKANHEEDWIPVRVGKGFTEEHLLPGMFIFGRETAAKELKMAPSTVRNRMRKLEEMGNIKIGTPKFRRQSRPKSPFPSHFSETPPNEDRQKDSPYSLITVVQWAFYQGHEEKRTGERTDKGQPKDTNKNDKKELFRQNSDEFRLALLLLNLILNRRNGFKRPDLQKWAKHIDLMIRIDNRHPDEIERVIRWCQGDAFWQNNILSTAKLRRNFDQLSMKMEASSNARSRFKRFDEEDFQTQRV